MFGLGMPEMVVILVVVMVLFGGKRLPELASGMGKAVRNFKKATTEPDEIDVTPKREASGNSTLQQDKSGSKS